MKAALLTIIAVALMTFAKSVLVEDDSLMEFIAYSAMFTGSIVSWHIGPALGFK